MLAIIVISLVVVSARSQQTSTSQLLANGEREGAGIKVQPVTHAGDGGGLAEAQVSFPLVANNSIASQVATLKGPLHDLGRQSSVPVVFRQSGPPNGRELGTGEERAALVALNGAAGGASWTNKWDLSSADHCSWYGVTCGSSGEVTRLDLRSNGLKGTLPAELNVLTSLTKL